MRLGRIRQLVHLAGGFRRFLQTPVSYDQAVGDIRRRLENRDRDFSALAQRLIYDIPSSPYRKLLLWAGCDWADLCANVKTHGLEKTLKQLWDAGVYLTLEEFKSGIPISRPGLNIETGESDFDNPFLGSHRLEGATSGSRGRSTRVAYDWEFITEESAHELLLYTMHGVLNAPTALWFPVPPGIAGIHNLLMNLKMGSVPEKWYSHTPTDAMLLEARLALRFIHWMSSSPRPEFVDLSQVDQVVAWLAGACAKRGIAVVRTYGSSAVRLAQTALASGVDISGSILFAGGEPLTEHRRCFIASTGAKVFPRYITTESGLVGAACPHHNGTDDMHLYKDRLAVIEREERLFYTSLTAHAGKIMLNTDLGDCGELTTKPCNCLFGELGFDQHLSNVRSNQKLTVEGMTLLASELYRAISVAVETAGGGPDSYQIRQKQDESGLSKLVITLSPDVSGVEEAKLVEAVLAHLQRGRPASALAADVWRQAATLQIVRERPQLSRGHKLLPAIEKGT
ncbi:MAG: hypothetical protein U1F76_03485 [Candidatus Competibacteraceae bacterium]